MGGLGFRQRLFARSRGYADLERRRTAGFTAEDNEDSDGRILLDQNKPGGRVVSKENIKDILRLVYEQTVGSADPNMLAIYSLLRPLAGSKTDEIKSCMWRLYRKQKSPFSDRHFVVKK